MKNKVVFLNMVLMVVIVLLPGVLLAQPGGFDDNVTDNPIPLDGGVSLLIAAGLGYGVKKVRDHRKATKG